MPTGTARPNFFIGPTSPNPLNFYAPLTANPGLVFHSHTVSKRRRVQPRALFQRAGVYADVETPATVIQLGLRIGINKEYQHDVDVILHSVWNGLGTDEFLLHFTNDDSADILTSTNVEVADTNVTVEFVEAAIPSWMQVGALVMYQGPGAFDEIVVVETVTSGSPNSFVADLVVNKASAGATIHAIQISYQSCVLKDIVQSALPMGKGSWVIQMECYNGSVVGGSLPA